MFGLMLSDPACNETLRSHAAALLHAQQIPLSGFTMEPARLFEDDMTRAAFLRRASWALMQPGEPVPLQAICTHLTRDALPGNILRRYTCLQLSLLPYLRPGRRIVQGKGCFGVGDSLLIAPVDENDCVDAILPPGQWTDLLSGSVLEHRLRCMRGYNEMPVLVRENTLLPVGVNDRCTCCDDEDRLTLHWYQPRQSAACRLANGMQYEASIEKDEPRLCTESRRPWHLILHRDGCEQLIR